MIAGIAMAKDSLKTMMIAPMSAHIARGPVKHRVVCRVERKSEVCGRLHVAR